MNDPLTPLPRSLLDALAAAGFDVGDLAAGAALTPDRVETGLTHHEADRFLTLAYERVGDPSFGLKAGCVLKPERMGVAGLAAMTSPTFALALRSKARYHRLVWGDGYEIHDCAQSLTVRVLPLDEGRPYGAAKVDMELASLLTFGRQFTGVAMVPLRLRLRSRPPDHAPLYRRVFDLDPEFDEGVNEISFSRRDAERPLISANAAAHAGLSEVAESELARLADGTLVREVRAVLQGLLTGDEPTLAAVARTMLMSERTLQRRLSAEGCSFSTLLDQTRQETAQRKLRVGRATASELAFLLGFADTNSFYRAFKRWTGTTPELYRRIGAPAGASACDAQARPRL